MTESDVPSVQGLIAKRLQLLARLEQKAWDEEGQACERLTLQLEQIDWQLAHTRATTLSGLHLKLARLADLICPRGFDIDDGLVETELFRALLDDLDEMIADNAGHAT